MLTCQRTTCVCISCFCTDPSQFLSWLARPTGQHQYSAAPCLQYSFAPFRAVVPQYFDAMQFFSITPFSLAIFWCNNSVQCRPHSRSFPELTSDKSLSELGSSTQLVWIFPRANKCITTGSTLVRPQDRPGKQLARQITILKSSLRA